MISATLVVVGGESADRELQLRLPSVIGRGRDATVTVQHSLVSRLHCEIFEREGRLFVRDLQSLNGTYINNFKINDEEPLMPGQLLTLGNMTFRACYEMPEMNAEEPVPNRSQSTNREGLETVRTVRSTPFDGSDNNSFSVSHALPDPDRMTANTVSAYAGSSDVLDGIGFLAIPPKSVSISALGNLPGPTPAVSFIGDIQGARPVAEAETDAISLDVTGVSPAKTVQPDDSALGSFIRKLPR